MYNFDAGSKHPSKDLWIRVRDCRLPSPPTVAQQLLTFFDSDDPDLSELARIISRDPVLSAKILKLINSPYYGLRREITSLSHAIVILGHRTVQADSMSFCLTQGLRQVKLKKVEHYERFWKRSLLSALCARFVSLSIGSSKPETAFLAALLQDIGILVLAEAFGEDYEELLTSADGDHDRLTALEQKSLRTDHLEIGSWLLQLWELPPIFKSAIDGSHGEASIKLPKSPFVRCVALSGYLADIFLRPDLKEACRVAAATAAQLLGFNAETLAHLLEGFGEKACEVSSFFEINLGDGDRLDSVWEEAQGHLA